MTSRPPALSLSLSLSLCAMPASGAAPQMLLCLLLLPRQLHLLAVIQMFAQLFARHHTCMHIRDLLLRFSDVHACIQVHPPAHVPPRSGTATLHQTPAPLPVSSSSCPRAAPAASTPQGDGQVVTGVPPPPQPPLNSHPLQSCPGSHHLPPPAPSALAPIDWTCSSAAGDVPQLEENTCNLWSV